MIHTVVTVASCKVTGHIMIHTVVTVAFCKVTGHIMIHTVVTVASCKVTGHVMINESTRQVFHFSTHNALLVLKVPRFAKHKSGDLLKAKTHQCIHSVPKPTFKQVWGLLFKDMVIRRENAHCFFLDTRQPTVSTAQGSLSKLLYQNKSIMKHQFFLTHCTHFYRREEKPDRSLTDQHLYMLCFYENLRRKNFFLWTQHFDRRCVCNPTV